MLQISLRAIVALSSLLTEFESKILGAIKLSRLSPVSVIGPMTLLKDVKHKVVNVETFQTILGLAKELVEQMNLEGTRLFLKAITDDLEKITLINLQDNLKKLQKLLEEELGEQWIMYIPKK